MRRRKEALMATRLSLVEAARWHQAAERADLTVSALIRTAVRRFVRCVERAPEEDAAPPREGTQRV